MEQRGMKVSRSKKEYLCIHEMEEDNGVNMGQRVKDSDRVQVLRLNY